MKVHTCIKELAEQCGMSVEVLAKQSGIPARTIQRIWDDGYVENITVSALARIAEALDVPTANLFV